MTDPATPSAEAPEPDQSADPRALIERQLAMLGRLADVGLNLAIAVETLAMAEADPGPDGRAAARAALNDLSLAYSRVSRGVRLTIALQSQVIEALRALDELDARQQRAAAAREQAERDRRGKVRNIVRRAIRAEAADDAEFDRMAGEARERLDSDAFGDLLARPVDEVIDRICRDLGLAPDWARMAEEVMAERRAEGVVVDAADPDDDPSRMEIRREFAPWQINSRAAAEAAAGRPPPAPRPLSLDDLGPS